MIGPDPAQPEAIYTATSWQGESSRQNDVELEVLGRPDLANATASPREASMIHSRRRKANHPSELSAITRFWLSHVHLSVEHKACRDHLGTFVWLNTV